MENQNEEEKVLKKIDKKISKEDKDNIIYTSFLETDDYILEQVNNASLATHATHATDTRFLIFNKKTASIDYQDNFLTQGREYCPIIDDLLLNAGILLPSGAEEYGTPKKLIDEIGSFFCSYFEVPKFFENFLPYLQLFYWVYEKFPFVPYLHFVGLTGTGKTTAQEVFGSVCYKPIDASGAITVSPIFRIATKWRGTLLLDEFEPDGENYKEMMALLKSGVSNKTILRTEGEKKKEVKVYLIKSPKVFTSEHPIKNAGLRSRTLVIQMDKNKRRIPLFRLQSFLDQALHIRNKLLLWRLRNFNNIDLKQIEYGFKELENFDRRVQQVVTPIYYLSDKDTKIKIINFAKTQEEETKRERRDSLEGQIFQYMIDIHPEAVTLKAIAGKINEDLPGRRHISEKKIGSIVRTIFGFDIKRLTHEYISTIIFDDKQDKIKELSLYFGIPVASEASEASVAKVNIELQEAPKNATHPKEEIDDLWNTKDL